MGCCRRAFRCGLATWARTSQQRAWISWRCLPARSCGWAPDALVEVTGLRNPCVQLDRFLPGLMAAVLDRDAQGQLVRKAGVMAVVLTGGTVHTGDPIEVRLPMPPHRPLAPV